MRAGGEILKGVGRRSGSTRYRPGLGTALAVFYHPLTALAIYPCQRGSLGTGIGDGSQRSLTASVGMARSHKAHVGHRCHLHMVEGGVRWVKVRGAAHAVARRVACGMVAPVRAIYRRLFRARVVVKHHHHVFHVSVYEGRGEHQGVPLLVPQGIAHVVGDLTHAGDRHGSRKRRLRGVGHPDAQRAHHSAVRVRRAAQR